MTRELIDRAAQPRAVVLDFAGVDFIDSQGSEKLGELRRLTAASEVALRLARVKPNIRAMLVADGVLAQLGPENVHGNVYEAVEAQLGHSIAGCP